MQSDTKAYLALRFTAGVRKTDITRLINEIEGMTSYFRLVVSEHEIYDDIHFKYIENPPSRNKKLNKLFDDFNYVFVLQFKGDNSGMRTLIRYHIQKRLQDLVIAITIAKNGSVDCGGAQIYFNNKLALEMPILIHTIDLALERAKQLKWPVLRSMPIKKAWLWYNSFSEETDGLSVTQIGRALNAFSNLYETKGGVDDQATLFWSLLAIEAIYAEGKDNIQQQVNDHTELFLGERKEFKKSFKDLYEYRSRFVHGNLNINNQFILKDGTDDFIKGLFKRYDNEGLAISILLATFQKLIRNNKREISFTKITKTVIK